MQVLLACAGVWDRFPLKFLNVFSDSGTVRERQDTASVHVLAHALRQHGPR